MSAHQLSSSMNDIWLPLYLLNTKFENYQHRCDTWTERLGIAARDCRWSGESRISRYFDLTDWYLLQVRRSFFSSSILKLSVRSDILRRF